MMIDENGTIVFTSNPYYFKIEQRGLKPNTIRLLSYSQMRQIRPGQETLEIEYIKKIRVVCTVEELKGYESFERELTSIEQIGELCGHYLFVFSWRHEGEIK